MRKCLNLLTVILIAALAVRAEAALLITEVVYDEAGTDADGEWIEIYNNGSTTLDLSNYKFGDEETPSSVSNTEATHRFPIGATIASGEVQIIAQKADRFHTLHGFLPNYEIVGTNAAVPNVSSYTGWDADGGIITLSNTGDQVYLLDENDNIIDGVSWITTTPYYLDQTLPATQVNVGQSYERISGLIDNDLAADWQLGNPASPGTVSIPEPATALMALLACCVLPTRRG
jgi:hypothetical protein